MIDPIQSSGMNPVGASSQPVTTQPAAGKSFKDVMLDSLEEVNRLQTEADKGVQALYSGEADNVAEVFSAINKAGIAFDLLMEIRNKLLDAYEDIQQIRV